MRCTKNCNACSQHLFSRKDPSLLRNNAWLHIARAMLQKLNELGYRVLPHPPYSPALCQLTTTSSSRLDNFLQGKSFHSQQLAENVFQEFVKPQSTDFFTLQEQTNLFLIGKNVLIVMVPILFIKICLSLVIMIWCKEPCHWKRPWCWERLRTGGEGDNRSWGGWMASPTQWTWVWANSRRSWRTEKPAMLQFMALQRVGHDWVTEWQYNDLNFMLWSHKYICNNLIHSKIHYVKKMMWFIMEIQKNLLLGNHISTESWRIRQIDQENDGEGGYFEWMQVTEAGQILRKKDRTVCIAEHRVQHANDMM